MRYLKKYESHMSKVPTWWNEKLSQFINDVFMPIKDDYLKASWQDQGDRLIFYITRSVVRPNDMSEFFKISLVKYEVEHLISELEGEYGYKLDSVKWRTIRGEWGPIYSEFHDVGKDEIFDGEKSLSSLEIKFRK